VAVLHIIEGVWDHNPFPGRRSHNVEYSHSVPRVLCPPYQKRTQHTKLRALLGKVKHLYGSSDMRDTFTIKNSFTVNILLYVMYNVIFIKDAVKQNSEHYFVKAYPHEKKLFYKRKQIVTYF
jgi:hypothetical protein